MKRCYRQYIIHTPLSFSLSRELYFCNHVRSLRPIADLCTPVMYNYATSVFHAPLWLLFPRFFIRVKSEAIIGRTPGVQMTMHSLTWRKRSSGFYFQQRSALSSFLHSTFRDWSSMNRIRAHRTHTRWSSTRIASFKHSYYIVGVALHCPRTSE